MKRIGFDLARLSEICARAIPETSHAGLLEEIGRLFPQLNFKRVLARGGWYRLGGIVDTHGGRISDDLAAWVEAESSAGVMALYNQYAARGYIATRVNGTTHYLVAQTGERPQDFIQLEVEEVEEVMDRRLFEEDAIPDLLDEIIDPLEYQRLEPTQVTPPRYLFRRIIPIADYLDHYTEKLDIKPPIVRFMSDWERSSAGEAAVFSDHWVLAFREYTDGYGEPRFNAKPITTYAGEIEEIAGPVPRGAKLANLIHGFDRQIGYPMAWYFFMLSHRQIPHQIAESIHQDLMGAYDYLPTKDVRLLQQWYDRAYGV